MNVSLTAELEALVQSKVNSGDYSSASEVIREGLRLLKEKDQLKDLRIEELRAEIQIGVDAIKEGNYTTISNRDELDEFMARIRQNGAKKLAKNSK